MTSPPRPPVLFLDIDGVLNSKQHFDRFMDEHAGLPAEVGTADQIDQRCVDLLNTVQGVEVVISSTWRLYVKTEVLRNEILSTLKAPIIGITPHLCDNRSSRYRGREVAAWVLEDERTHGGTRRQGMVILDDDGDFAGLEPWFVQTEYYDNGLELADMVHVFKALREPMPSHELLKDLVDGRQTWTTAKHTVGRNIAVTR